MSANHHARWAFIATLIAIAATLYLTVEGVIV